MIYLHQRVHEVGQMNVVSLLHLWFLFSSFEVDQEASNE